MKKEYCYRYPHPALTADCVAFGFDGQHLKVLLIQRKNEPFKDAWALPGGFVNIDESAEECAIREIYEETGLKVTAPIQFHTFSDPGRDPRERVVSVAYYTLVSITEVNGQDDAANAEWYPIDRLPALAFDHSAILKKALSALREQLFFSPVCFTLLPTVFTMPELQRLYEEILGVNFDRRNFAKKILKLGLIEPLPRACGTPSRYPVQYRFISSKYKELKSGGNRVEF